MFVYDIISFFSNVDQQYSFNYLVNFKFDLFVYDIIKNYFDQQYTFNYLVKQSEKGNT